MNKKSPHYIPDLDPSNPDRKRNAWHWIWLTMAIGSGAAFGGAGWAWYAGSPDTALMLAIAGLLLFAPFLFAAAFGGVI